MAAETGSNQHLSIIEHLQVGYNSCGYCGNGRAGRGNPYKYSSKTLGGWADFLTVDQYQYLLDRGWRRSGRYLYHPFNNETCCPQYTIRLDVHKFQPSKEQRRVRRKLDALLSGKGNKPARPPKQPAHTLPSEATKDTTASSPVLPVSPTVQHSGPSAAQPLRPPSRGPQSTLQQGASQSNGYAAPEQAPEPSVRLQELLHAALAAVVASGALPALEYPPLKLSAPTAKQSKQLSASVRYTSPIALAAAAKARQAGSTLAAGDLADLLARDITTRLQQAAAEPQMQGNSWSVQAMQGHLNFLFYCTDIGATHSAQVDDVIEKHSDLSRHQQTASTRPQRMPSNAGSAIPASLQQDSPAPMIPSSAPSPMPAAPPGDRQQHGLETTLVKMPCSEAVLHLELPLFQKYQMGQHKEKRPSMNSFTNFLVDTPLLHPYSEAIPGEAPAEGYGTYHQQYWLDGVLVAVGVLDVLPCCLSSVYFFWDPDLAHLSLGKLSALQEIEWTRALSEPSVGAFPALRYYCMGYYIHSCPKMRYKVAFQPSELLCSEALVWVPVDRVTPTLDACPYAAFSRIPGALQGLGVEHNVWGGRPRDPAATQASREETGSTVLLLRSCDPPQLIRYSRLIELSAPAPGHEPLFTNHQAVLALEPMLQKWKEFAGTSADGIAVAI